MSRPRVLVVDNFDSFTYNLVEYLSEHAECEVRRNTATLAEIRRVDPDAVVVSPGPGHPKNDRDVGVTLEVFRDLARETPTLGVCLGLEAAVYAYGGTVGRAPEPVHGKAFPVDHDGRGVFTDLPSPLRGGRYHSLVATGVPECFEVSATTGSTGEQAVESTGSTGEQAGASDSDSLPDDTLVMGIRHREYPIECVQFHPESVLTSHGHDLVRNFLAGV